MAYNKRGTWYGLQGDIMKAFQTKEEADVYESGSVSAPVIKEAPKVEEPVSAPEPALEVCEDCECDPCECKDGEE